MTQRTIAQDGRQTVTTLPPAGSSPSTARRIVESVVNAHRLDNVLDEALLLVTELVTNAVVHAGTDIDVRVDAGDKRLRVEVIDRTPGLLHIDSHLPSDQREGGRGLLLLDALAAEWGTRHFSWGKSVWFVLVTQEETADVADGAGQATSHPRFSVCSRSIRCRRPAVRSSTTSQPARLPNGW